MKYKLGPQSVVVMQARTGSSRLPAKVLLPIARMPLVVLAARRAANTGRKVIVATSSEPDDDELIETLKYHKIPYSRGCLNNPLERMIRTVDGYGDDTVFIRLTADNAFPDGHLIDEVEADFQARSIEYLYCGGVLSGLPHGMSVEVTRVKYLREAGATTICPFDQEHVTPYIKRKYGVHHFCKHQYLAKSHHRCSIDHYEDYINICKVFSGVSNPITAPSIELVHRLKRCTNQPLAQAPVPKLVIGAAQIGFEYGIANSSGRPDISEVELMLKTAVNNGVVFIDTARAYGISEQVIGDCFSGELISRIKVSTKLSPLLDIPPNADAKSVQAWVDSSVFESCMRLRRQSLDVLMLHRASHFGVVNGKVWERLIELQQQSIIDVLGVSIQTPQELAVALDVEDIGFIQMPLNIIDWRWTELEKRIVEEKQKRNLTVHVRSSLLQGLLISSNKNLWRQANMANPETVFSWLKKMVRINDCDDVIDLCLRYVRSKSWVDGVVIGMENNNQMVKNIKYFNQAKLSLYQLEEIESSRPQVAVHTLDPSLWHQAKT